MTREAPVHIVPYDTSWPGQFEQERSLLFGLIGEWVNGTIEHVGSTAVPGLDAKPVIDVMVGVLSLDASRDAVIVLERNGYLYAEYKTDVMHWLCKPSLAYRTHHLHLMPYNSPLWKERLVFRNSLRSHSDIAREYAALKYQLAEQYRFDREAYTEAKSEFIRRVLKAADLTNSA
jgi:GrpB-like predicted nucleotidyltransferase (UPF0157 family)